MMAKVFFVHKKTVSTPSLFLFLFVFCSGFVLWAEAGSVNSGGLRFCPLQSKQSSCSLPEKGSGSLPEKNSRSLPKNSSGSLPKNSSGSLPPKCQEGQTSTEMAENDLEGFLQRAFKKAFRSRIEFERCGIFQILGYTAKELEQIGYITPLPATLKLNFIKKPDGAFEFIRVDCRKIHYYGMTVERAVFIFNGCELDLKSLAKGDLRFNSASKIELELEVSEADLLSAFASLRKARNLSALKIRLKRNLATIRGRMRSGLLVVDFKIDGTTKQIGSKKIDFVCKKMVMNGSVVPRNTVNALFKTINPVFNTQSIWLNLNIKNIKINKGFVETKAVIEAKPQHTK